MPIPYWFRKPISTLLLFKKVQKHLICKELENNEYFNDPYVITGSAQIELFNKLIIKYCSINIQVVTSFDY